MDPRETFDKVLRAALDSVEPGAAVRRTLRVRAKTLTIGRSMFPLRGYRRAVVAGAGKAALPMAAAAADVLRDLPVEGLVIAPHGAKGGTGPVEVRRAAHPLPDAAGVDGSRALAKLVESATSEDLVIMLISGGASSLLGIPAEGLTLDDLRATDDLLLKSGAAIGEINAVRKHLDRLKGGRLAVLAAPATLITIVLSDVVGADLSSIGSGPTVPDPTALDDCLEILDRYHIAGSVPPAVLSLLRSGPAAETPKPGDAVFNGALTVLAGDNRLACRAAAAEAQQLGLNSLVLTAQVTGEAREVAKVLAGVLREVDASGMPVPRPCCIVAGGETTVTVRGSGKGGRNQEVALSAALALDGVRDVLFASIGSDGVDGPTDAAGGIVDGTTAARARTQGLDIRRALAENDSYPLLKALDGLVMTGPTGTNVCDLYLLFAF